MVRRLMVAGVGLTLALSLTACGQAAETMTEAATGADVEMSGDGMTITDENGASVTVDGEGNVSMTDESTGLKVETGANATLPAGLPSGFPLPPEGAVLATTGESPEGIQLAYAWDGLDRATFDAYVASVKAAGYDKDVEEMDTPIGDNGFSTSVAMSNGAKKVFISAFGQDGVGQLSLMISDAQ